MRKERYVIVPGLAAGGAAVLVVERLGEQRGIVREVRRHGGLHGTADVVGVVEGDGVITKGHALHGARRVVLVAN